MARRRRVPTPSQTLGPFFGFALPFEGDSEAVEAGTPDAVRIEGQVIDGSGQVVPDALIEVWQDGQFARCRTDGEGAFHFTIRKPPPIRSAGGRDSAPHLNVTVFARGLLRQLVTRMYFPDEGEANASDAVLAVVDPERRPTLIARRDGDTLTFDLRLQGLGETAFFAL